MRAVATAIEFAVLFRLVSDLGAPVKSICFFCILKRSPKADLRRGGAWGDNRRRDAALLAKAPMRFNDARQSLREPQNLVHAERRAGELLRKRDMPNAGPRSQT
jgi:hypothetical protein